MKNTPGTKIHKKLIEIIAEVRRLERNYQTDTVSYNILIKETDILRREYRKLHGFDYNPIFYCGGEDVTE